MNSVFKEILGKLMHRNIEFELNGNIRGDHWIVYPNKRSRLWEIDESDSNVKFYICEDCDKWKRLTPGLPLKKEITDISEIDSIVDTIDSSVVLYQQFCKLGLAEEVP